MTALRPALIELGLNGMVRAYDAQALDPSISRLSFDERALFLAQEELGFRKTRRYERIVKEAGFPVLVDPTSISFDDCRGIGEPYGRELLQGHWIAMRQKVVISGATGTGKSWLACGLGMAAATRGDKVKYFKAHELYETLMRAATLGRGKALRTKLMRIPLLIIDDFGLLAMPEASRGDFFSLIDGRHGSRATIFAGQLPFENWHAYLADPTVAEALLDRIGSACHFINLKGDSRRERLQ